MSVEFAADVTNVTPVVRFFDWVYGNFSIGEEL